MKTIAALVLLLAAAGCSSPTDALPGDFTTEADAGTDVIVPPTSTGTAGAAGAPGADSGGKGGAGGSGGQAPDAAPATDSGTKVDTGTDAGTAPDATPDTTPPTVDAGTTGNDAAPPRVDAGNDARDSTDAATADVDGGNVDLICKAASPKCDSPNQADALIRATYQSQPCATNGASKCGAVQYPDVVETLPMLCNEGAWRLAGSWSGSQWVAAYGCSTGCDVGKLCTP